MKYWSGIIENIYNQLVLGNFHIIMIELEAVKYYHMLVFFLCRKLMNMSGLQNLKAKLKNYYSKCEEKVQTPDAKSERETEGPPTPDMK